MSEGDRRRFVREACLISAWLREGQRIHEGTLLNISEDGAYLATRATPAAGQQYQLRFRHPWSEEMVNARVRVVRRVASGGREGPQQGLGLRLEDALSALEEAGTTSTSLPSDPGRTDPELRKVAARAFSAAAKAASMPPAPRRPERLRGPGTEVRFLVAERPEGVGRLGDVSDGGFAVHCPDPPPAERIARVEIEIGGDEPPLRVAAKIAWSAIDSREGRPAGFGAKILHFLSPGDEGRWNRLVRRLGPASDPGGAGGGRSA